MALARIYHVTCDVCGRSSLTPDSRTDSAAAARRTAKTSKWTREAGADICPACRVAGWKASTTWPDGYDRLLRRVSTRA